MASPNRQSDDDDEEDSAPRRKKSKLPAGTPTVYVHEKCKGETEMPENYIRDYLDNPFELGDEPYTQCAECGKELSWSKFYWADTEQYLDEYLDDLRAEMILSGDDPRPETPGFNWLLPILGAVLGGAAGAGIGKKAGFFIILTAAGIAVGAAGGAVWMFIERNKNIEATKSWNRQLLKRYYKRHPEAEEKSKKRKSK